MELASISTRELGFASQIIEKIEASDPDIVCFDYFDTLVSRSVYPESVKKITCGRLEKLIGGHTDIPGWLYGLRFEAEAAICRENEEAGFDLDFNIRHLFSRLWEADTRCQLLERDVFVQLAVDLEVATECSVQTVDSELIQVLEYLQSRGKTMWLISDFYIPRADFQRMLNFHGIGSYFQQFEVSADSLLTKRSGRIYTELLDRNGWTPDKVIMIGDSQVADFDSARAAGLLAIHLDRSHQHDVYAGFQANPADAIHEIENILSSEMAVFKELSLTLFHFIERLYDSLVLAGARDVYFMAREGQFLKVLFDRFRETRAFTNRWYIRSHYVEVSRRSTFLPSLGPLNDENFETLLRQYRRISLHEFLSSLALDQYADRISDALNLDVHTREEDLPTSASFDTLLKSNLFQEIYERERVSRLDAFITYFRTLENGSGEAGGDIHFVDIGWKGTIQDNLRNIFDNAGDEFAGRRIVGHYAGLVAPGSASPRNVKVGHVFSSVGHRTDFFEVFDQNRALFEVALGANHGSALEYSFDSMGRPWVRQSPFSEAALYYGRIHFFQLDLLRIFLRIDGVVHRYGHRAQNFVPFVVRNHARMVFNPTRREARWFQNAFHHENFGVFEISRFMDSTMPANPVKAAKFYLDLRRNKIDSEMGFWPWLTCRTRGGRFTAWRFGSAQLKLLERKLP